MSLFKSEISKHLTNSNPEIARQASRTWPGMAHFAGTGPFAASCGKCKFFGTNGRTKKQPCAKFTQMMNGVRGAEFPPSTAACKYYEDK